MSSLKNMPVQGKLVSAMHESSLYLRSRWWTLQYISRSLSDYLPFTNPRIPVTFIQLIILIQAFKPRHKKTTYSWKTSFCIMKRKYMWELRDELSPTYLQIWSGLLFVIPELVKSFQPVAQLFLVLSQGVKFFCHIVCGIVCF